MLKLSRGNTTPATWGSRTATALSLPTRWVSTAMRALWRRTTEPVSEGPEGAEAPRDSCGAEGLPPLARDLRGEGEERMRAL